MKLPSKYNANLTPKGQAKVGKASIPVKAAIQYFGYNVVLEEVASGNLYVLTADDIKVLNAVA
ncbi:MAG: hypothetical protein PHO26_11070 [Dehalococcoidia bacterium]|nr:hypothetical protein [Dehalococcoidia bacterium]MDD5494728.1 hypothetical protein [Dehalococcoidia bacterium]